MVENFGDTTRAKRSLETVKNSKNLLPSFYNKGGGKRENTVWSTFGVPIELLLSFDLAPEYPENFGTLCAARLVSPKFIEIAEAEGFASDLCSYLTNSMGYLPTPS